MSSSFDLDATEPIVDWPESISEPPEGWHWGRHVSLGARGTGYYMIRDRDGACLIARQRPDIDEAPDEDEIEAATEADARFGRSCPGGSS